MPLRIAQYLSAPSAWGSVTPETMHNKGLGGRETALVQLAEQWASTGHEVMNFVRTEEPYRTLYPSGGRSSYVDVDIFGDVVINFPVDVIVSWEESRLFKYPKVRDAARLTVIEMQVAHLDTTEECDAGTDVYAALSPWASEFLGNQGHIKAEKIVVLPNGIDVGRYSAFQPAYNSPKNTPLEFFYSSSPDRGLHHLLNLWPRLRAKYPDSLLHVCYGVEHWTTNVRWSHNMQAETALDVEEGLKQDGVVYHGKIGQTELAELQQRCDLLLYPCDPMQPTETGCITIIEAGAAGVPVVTTNADCLGSEFGMTTMQIELPFSEDAYLEAIDQVLSDKGLYYRLQQHNYWLAMERSWANIAEAWLDMFHWKMRNVDQAAA